MYFISDFFVRYLKSYIDKFALLLARDSGYMGQSLSYLKCNTFF